MMRLKVSFEAAGQDLTKDRYRFCRRMLVGPWCNQPEEYEGYNGFVGWAGITRLRSGRWLLTFTSGCWHVSVPWTEEIRNDPESRKKFEEWQKMGLPDIRSPRGGRAHIMHSDDEGLTWSKPETLIDSEHDDRHPTILELDDGTLLCTYFTYALPNNVHSWHMRSTDGGKTWSKPQEFPGESYGGFINGCSHQMLLPDGSIYCVYIHTGGHPAYDARTQALWAIRVKVHPEANGIDILPAPGAPAERGDSISALESMQTEGGDPELGNL